MMLCSTQICNVLQAEAPRLIYSLGEAEHVATLCHQGVYVILPLWSHCDELQGVGPCAALSRSSLDLRTGAVYEIDPP